MRSRSRLSSFDRFLRGRLFGRSLVVLFAGGLLAGGFSSLLALGFSGLLALRFSAALDDAIRHGCGHDRTKQVQFSIACDETRGMLIVVGSE